MNYRIERRPGWKPIVAGLRSSAESTVAACARLVASRARKILADNSFDLAQLPAESDSKREALLRQLAEAFDSHYLDSLDQVNGNADDGVLREFAIARALAALVYLAETPAANSILESAYELCAISTTEDDALRTDVAAALTTKH